MASPFDMVAHVQRLRQDALEGQNALSAIWLSLAEILDAYLPRLLQRYEEFEAMEARMRARHPFLPQAELDALSACYGEILEMHRAFHARAEQFVPRGA